MSEDWVIIGTDGGITSKENFLAFISSGDLKHSKMDFEDLRIEIYDNTGVVTSRGTSSGTYKDQPFTLYEWSSNVFIRKEGKWQCVLTMLTPAKKIRNEIFFVVNENINNGTQSSYFFINHGVRSLGLLVLLINSYQ